MTRSDVLYAPSRAVRISPPPPVSVPVEAQVSGSRRRPSPSSQRRRRPPAPAAGVIVQVVLLALLALAAGLGLAGWLAGLAYAAGLGAALAVAMRRWGVRSLGPADRVTLARAALTGCVTAIVADAFRTPAAPITLLVAVAAAALVLDGVDGHVARRTGTASPLGARFDMEVDAFLILVLSVFVAGSLGAWVLAIGAMRYGFAAASRPLRWLAAPLPPSMARKTIAALQGVALTVAAAGVLPRPAAVALVGLALAALAWSFGRDIHWLARAYGRDRALMAARGLA
jgi:phosphatidylglycerophosphate synthase